MLRGSCCCGEVRFEINAAPSMMATCHCSRCRKAGASTFVFVPRGAFRLIAGEDRVRHHRPAPPYSFVRSFCGDCGSALGEIGGDSDPFPIAAHALDDDPGVRNRFHEYVADKPEWSMIGDDAKQFAGDPRAAWMDRATLQERDLRDLRPDRISCRSATFVTFRRPDHVARLTIAA